MNILSQISDLRNLPGPLHLAIGVFDGLHTGHRKVIETAIHGAQESGGTALVMTFDPHPVRVICPDRSPRLLASLRHKLHLLHSIGIRHVLVQTFTKDFAEVTAEDFIAQLVEAGQPLRQICVGRDWRFGKERKGDHHLLQSEGEKHQFTVSAIAPVKCGDGSVISSTRIRHAIQLGDFESARQLLGRDYTVLGEVIEGRKLGRTIGFPTANLRVFNEELPPSGVYAVEALLTNGKTRKGIANLGYRPTIEGESKRRLLEVHLFDFDQDIYGQELEIRFGKFIRPEKKFDSLDSLKSQIAQDVLAAR